jgi:hypothetical protein
MTEVTQILSQIEQGDPQASEELRPFVYEELLRLSAPANSTCLVSQTTADRSKSGRNY